MDSLIVEDRLEWSGVPILMYHRIGPIGLTRASRQGSVPTTLFAAHLRTLKRMGYEGISMARLVEGWSGKAPLPARPVVLTFDDGYADVFRYALPAVRLAGWSATVYAVSALVGKTSQWRETAAAKKVPLADAGCLMEAQAEGFEIGAHSRTHPLLTQISAEAAKEEIVGSKRDLEDMLGAAVRSFCYPYGDESSALRQVVSEAGFESATTVARGWATPEDDRMALPRIAINSWRLSPKGLLDLIRSTCEPQRLAEGRGR